MSNKMGVTGILILLLCVGKIQADKMKPNMQCSSKDIAEINLCSMALWRSLDDICFSSPVSLFRSTASWFAVLGQFEKVHHNLTDYMASDTMDKANKRNMYTSQTVKEAKQANTISGQNANDAEATIDKPASDAMNGLTCKTDSAQELQAICREFKTFKSCVGDIGVDSRCEVHPKLFAIKLAFDYVCGEGKDAVTTQKCFGGRVTMRQLFQASTKHDRPCAPDALASAENCVSTVKGPYSHKRNAGLQRSYRCICTSVDQFLECLALGALMECGEEGQRLFEGYRQHALAAVADLFPDLDQCTGKPPLTMKHALQLFVNVATKSISDMIKAMAEFFRSQVQILAQDECEPLTNLLKASICAVDFGTSYVVDLLKDLDGSLQPICNLQDDFNQCLDTELDRCSENAVAHGFRRTLANYCSFESKAVDCPHTGNLIFEHWTKAERKCGTPREMKGFMYLTTDPVKHLQKLTIYGFCLLPLAIQFEDDFRASCGDDAADNLMTFMDDLRNDATTIFQEVGSMDPSLHNLQSALYNWPI